MEKKEHLFILNILSKMGQFVNSYQTKDERKEKYKLVMDHGATTKEARIYRDWTKGHLERIAIPFLVGRKLNAVAGK